jgi:hypothetical protein
MNPQDIAKKYGATFTPATPEANSTDLSSIASKYGATFTPTVQQEEKPVGGLQSFVQSIAEKPLSLLAQVASAGRDISSLVESAVGNKAKAAQIDAESALSNKQGYDFGYFGKVKPITAQEGAVDSSGFLSPTGVKKTIGAAAETGSLFAGGGGTAGVAKAGFKQGVKATLGTAVKQAVKQEAKIGAVTGGTMSFGDAISEAENSTMDVAYQTLFGTVLGATAGALIAPVAPLASKAVQKVKGFTNVSSLETKLAEGYKKIFNPNARQIKVDTRFGNDSFKFMAQEMPDLPITVNSNGKIDATNALEMAKAKYTAEATAYKPIIRNSGKYVDLDEVVANMKAQARKEFDGSDLTKAEAQIDDEVNSYLRNSPQDINVTANGKRFLTLSRADDIKSYSWSRGKGWGTPEAEVWNDTNNIIGHSLKDAIEKQIPEAPIKAMNRRLGQWKNAIDMLEKRNGQVAGSGGKLSKLLSRNTGSIIGGTIGTATGDNTVMGGITGAGTGFMTASILAGLLSNPNVRLYVVRKLLNNLSKAGRSDLIQEAEQILQQQSQKYLLPAAGKSSYVEKPIVLPTSARETNLGINEVKGMNQSSLVNEFSSATNKGQATKVNTDTINTTLTTKNNIPESVPQNTKKSTPNINKEVSGGVAGLEIKKDENGKTTIKFNPEKAMIGIVGMTAYKRIPEAIKKEAKIKLTTELEDLVAKELSNLDTLPVTTNAGLAFGKKDSLFELELLKTKMEKKALSRADIFKAIPLLKEQNIDVLKDAVQKVTKYKQNPITGKLEGSTKK